MLDVQVNNATVETPYIEKDNYCLTDFKKVQKYKLNT